MGSSFVTSVSNRSFANASLLFCFVALVAALLPAVSKAEAEDSGCNGGTCPFPANMPASGAPGSKMGSNAGGTGKDNDGECGLWMGPSPIKQAEDHGFGLGIFTGKAIPKGTAIESVYGHGELLLPIFGSDDIYDQHPPIREYIWD